MPTVYKYRANLFDEKKGFRQDTKSLIDGEFFAAPFKLLNDPFEASVELPKSQDQEHWVTPLIQRIYSAGIYSLAKLKEDELFPENELMWAHYANSHQGFCIEYDLDKLTEGNYTKGFNISNVIRVEYADENPKITEPDNMFTVQKKAFGTKSKPWKYENEVRLVFETNGVKPIANGAIKSIYLGLNIGFSEWTSIIDGLKGSNVEFYQIIRIGKLYKLQCVKLDFNYEYEVVRENHNNVVENYTILYKSNNKDENSILRFIKQLRQKYHRIANFIIIDDLRADKILNDYKPRNEMTVEEIRIMSEHWVALSTFDAPDIVFMYPEK